MQRVPGGLLPPLLLSLALALLGCRVIFTEQDIIRRHVRVDTGPALAGGPCSFWLAWSADGAEVLYPTVGTMCDQVSAVRIDDGTSRVLGQPVSAYQLLVAQDGSAIHAVVSSPTAPYVLVQELLHGTSHALQEGAPVGQSRLSLSPSGAEVAYVARRAAGPEVALLEPLTEGGATELPCRSVPIFAPGGDEVACFHRDEPYPLVRMGLDGSGVVQLHQPPRGAYFTGVWTADGLRLAGSDEVAQYVFDEPTATVRVVGKHGEHTETWITELTRDGRGLAYSERECLANPDVPVSLKCDYYEGRVRVMDLTTGKLRTVASGKSDYNDFPSIALSPDGSSIAYTFGDHLYVRPTGL